MRDHKPIPIEEFNGLWKRGDDISCPPDHFRDCNNLKYFESGFGSRDGIGTVFGPGSIIRMYRYKSPQFSEGLISLDEDGKFWHTTYNPDANYLIATIPDAEDFVFIEINGRAYFSPITGIHGTVGEFLYVYLGDTIPARKAAGNPPVNGTLKPLIAFNSETDGKIDKGIHVIAVAFFDGADRSSALGTEVSAVINAPGGKEAHINNIPIGPGGTTAREVYSTKAIDPKDYNPASLPTFYLVTTINDNTTINKDISYADIDLTTPFAAGALSVPSDGGALRVANSPTDGHCDFGFRLIGVVYETDTGFLTAPGPEIFGAMNAVSIKKALDVSNIPVSPDSFVTKRHLVSTKVITNYNGDQTGYQFFFIPDGTIEDNITTTKTVSYYDAELLEDASYLIDNFSEIPAGAALGLYKGRLAIANGDFGEGVIYLSKSGEPEAVDRVDGVLIPPLPTEQINNLQEFRDVLYVFKENRTYSYVDNDDVPSTWSKPGIIDSGIGAGFHSVATVLDSLGVNVEYLIVGHTAGVYLFTGTYIQPELTWKIEDYWKEFATPMRHIQIFQDSINKLIYSTLPNGKMLFANYANGLNAKKIKWTPVSFDTPISTIAILSGPRLLLGSSGN